MKNTNVYLVSNGSLITQKSINASFVIAEIPPSLILLLRSITTDFKILKAATISQDIFSDRHFLGNFERFTSHKGY